jgi:two-component sensor histidine kinase
MVGIGYRVQALPLRVEDPGCGFPDALNLRATESLGLQPVCALAEQLQGTIGLKRTAGTQVTILFPLVTAPALS